MDLPLTEVTVTATTYSTDPDVNYGFMAESTLVVNRTLTTGDEVRFSFDGISDNGAVIAGLVPAIEWRGKRAKIWLRRLTAGTSVVNVMANTVP